MQYSRETGNQFASPPAPCSPNLSRRTTPVPFSGDTDYMKMLREAQRENSARSSARVSPISSALMSRSSTCRNTPSTSPKSPPNSPNTELADFEDNLIKGVIVNREAETVNHNWRSRPNVHPPRASWKMTGTSSKTSSGSQSDSEERRLEKADYPGMLTALVASNLTSLVLGALAGYWFFKRASSRMSPS